MQMHRYRFLMVLAFCLLCFSPGFTGGFIFDDNITLRPLGDNEHINSLEKLVQYIFGGTTGPGGRPIALLTFVMNAQSWPADPFPFLVTNVGIHLFNGLLVYILLTKLFANFNYAEGRISKFLPLIATAFWMLHPLQLSSVLYVVQRMTTLAATFILITFIIYIEFRRALIDERWFRCGWLIGAGAVGFGLAFFTKEIALLLPLQLLILELFLGVIQGDVRGLRQSKLRKFIIFPAAAVFLSYVLWVIIKSICAYLQTGIEPSGGRAFTMSERLFTEGRVLGDYIVSIVIPRSQTAGVFYDGYEVSKGLLDPPSTIWCWSAHLAVITAAIRLRSRFPVIFFGVMWFYINHVLESTVFMLELKFDHRNYLASLGWAIIVARGVLCNEIPQKWQPRIAVGYGLLLGGLLFTGARLWGDPLAASLVWVEKNPNSYRALDYAASNYAERPETLPRARELIKQAVEVSHHDPDLEIKLFWINCGRGEYNSTYWPEVIRHLKVSRLDWSIQLVLGALLDRAVEGGCPELVFDDYIQLIEAVRQNPAYANTSIPSTLMEQKVAAAFFWGRPEQGLAIFRSQDLARIPVAVIVQQALLVASHGYKQEAADALEKSLIIQKNNSRGTEFDRSQYEEILGLIKADIDKDLKSEGE